MRSMLRALPLCLIVACSGAAEEPAANVGADGAAPAIDATADATTDVDAAAPDASAPADGAASTDAPPETPADTASPEVGDDAASGASLVPATAACSPAPPTCPPPVAEKAVRASYRKDAWLPSYAEDGDAPTSGGRLHVAAISNVTGTITKVTIDGVDVSALSTPDLKPSIEWAHAWPKKLVAGEPVWVQFHARAAKWDSASSGTLRIETDAGVAFDGSFPVAKTTVPITWVTTTDDLSTAIVHVANRDTAARTVKRVLIDGRDVTASACLPQKTLAAGATALITVPLCAPWSLGHAWTVAVEYADATTAVGVGRVVRPFHPVEAWNNTTECPFPGAGGKASNYDAIVVKGGVDTLYTHGGVCGACGCDTYKLVNETLPGAGIQTLLTDDVATSIARLTNLAGVAAFSTGDESDGAVFEAVSSSDKRLYSVPAKKAERSELLWGLYPGLPTFNGGKTNKNIGTFAGMADVQGMDFYIGACAPHITRFGTDYPLRGAYDYLRNTRENHMPLPTFLYAQGLSPAWRKRVEVGGVTLVDYFADPSASEITVQAFHVLAAGGKGFLWFQVNQDRAKASPESWSAIVRMNKITRAVRELVREGDVTGGAKTAQKALVEAIRARDAIVVPVIDEEVTARPTDTACSTAASAAALPHWRFGAQKVSVDVAIPADLGVAEVFEVTADGPKDFPTVGVAGRTVTLKDVAVDEATPARLFVLARTKDVRGKVAAAK
jgi:hypothetical protein